MMRLITVLATLVGIALMSVIGIVLGAFLPFIGIGVLVLGATGLLIWGTFGVIYNWVFGFIVRGASRVLKSEGDKRAYKENSALARLDLDQEKRTKRLEELRALIASQTKGD